MSHTKDEVLAMADRLSKLNVYGACRDGSEMLRAYAAILEHPVVVGDVPSYWAAIGDVDADGSGGEIVLAYPADDGNAGEAAREECNQYINDALLNDGVKLHLTPLYTRAALESLASRKVAYPALFTGTLDGKPVGLRGTIESVEALETFVASRKVAVPQALVASGNAIERYIGTADGSFGVTVRDSSDWREAALFILAGAILTSQDEVK